MSEGEDRMMVFHSNVNNTGHSGSRSGEIVKVILPLIFPDLEQVSLQMFN